MRKFVLAAVALVFSFGLALAAEVTFVKFDKESKKLTVKDGDKESTYEVTDKVKATRGDKDVSAEDVTKMLEKAKEGKTKFEITEKEGKLTGIKFKEGKKKAAN